MTTTRVELLEIIRNGENSGVEFKRDVLQNHDLAKELVALANLEGGIVLLGVEDDGSICGLTRPRLEEWVMTTCRDKIRPGVIPFFETIRDVDQGRDVAVVRVPRGVDVHTLWHNNRHTYYIRVGSQSREPTPEELRRLFQQRRMLRAELQPVAGVTLADLDLRRLKDYFGTIRQQAVPEDNDTRAWESLLLNTEIMAEEGVTLAGVILFAQNPNRFVPHAGLDAAAFPGREKDYAALERAGIRGPMVPLLDSDRRLVEAGLVEQSVEFIRRNTGVVATLQDGARRLERPVYPPEAVREAVVNALIHRDYLLAHTDIELAIYENRIEIVSPGRLSNGITPARMRAGCRASRNQLIKDVMRDYGYLEHMGMGIPRKIIRGMRDHNGTEPDLVEDDERFIVRLFAAPPA